MLITPMISLTPPQGYKLELVNTEQNRVILREQLQHCGHLSYLVNKFEEKYMQPEVKSVWLIWKLIESNGFQDWHQDLACNGQTVYTIVVELGSFEIQVDAEEINKTTLTTLHMLLTFNLHLHSTILVEIMKASPMMSMK